MNEKIRTIFSEILKFEKDIYNIPNDANLIELGLNSVNAIEMVVYLEDTFGIEIRDEDLMIDNMSSINQICELLKRYGVEE